MALDNLRWLDYYRPEYELHVSRGVVPGAMSLLKFGNLEATNTLWQAVWPNGGKYPFPEQAVTLEVNSTLAADTFGTGAGAWTLDVQGLDEDWNPQTVTVNMNGTNWVLIPGTWQRVFRATAQLSGTYDGATGANLGDITLRRIDTLVTLLVIRAGEGQTRMCIYTVPNGWTGYLHTLMVSGESNKAHEFRVMGHPRADIQTGPPYGGVRSLGNINGVAGVVQVDAHYGRISSKADIWIEAKTTGAAGEVQAQMAMQLIRETREGE